MKPFEQEPKIIYEKDSFRIVVGKATTNPEEKLCIGLSSNGFPRGDAYVVFPPRLSLNFLTSLLGEDGAEDEEIMEAIRTIVCK